VLLIPLQKCGDAHGEMLVSAMGSSEEGMAMLVMEQQERSAAQDHAQTPDQPAREKHVTVDGFAMPIHITGQRKRPLGFLRFSDRMPELSSPARESIGEAFDTISAS
jgi:hypothetical protein